MARTAIHIDYPPERLAANARRLRRAQALLPVDRAPVLAGAYDRYFLAQRGISLTELYADPATCLYHKIMNQAWAIQHMPDDRCLAPEIVVAVDFQNAANASAFGAEVRWGDERMPWACPVLHSPEDIDHLEIPAPDAGLWGRMLAWYEAMRDGLADYQLFFNGQEAPITLLPPDPGGEGPFTVASQLAGTDLYLWLALYPEACHALLRKITIGLLRQHRYVRDRYPRPALTNFALANDGAEVLSPQMFREFCVPYDNQLYDALGAGLADGRSKHMCGQIDHLLSILVGEEHITSLWGFGEAVDPALAAAAVGGRCWAQGNVSPVLLLQGSRQEVRQAAERALAAFADCGGLILSEGYNVSPGTPLESIAALVEAAEAWGPLGAKAQRRETDG